MLGIAIAFVSSAFSELSDSIGKKKVNDGVASYYTFGFLNLLFGTAILIFIAVWRHTFLFSPASLPTFIPRVFLEILQAHVGVLAVIKADRGDFGPIKTLTVPLLLIVDILLGYTVTPIQIFGVALISVTILLLLAYENFQTKGLMLILVTAVNAVATISLYKYDITHFNSVESEQMIVQLILLLYFFVLAVRIGRENPLSFLTKRPFLIQAMASGPVSSVGSFAYMFAPASVITAALRAFAVLFSILSGRFYFKEGKFILKIFVFLGILTGLILLL